MLDQKDVQIGDDVFLIESLPATKSLALLAELSIIAGGMGMGITDLPSNTDEIAKAFNLGAMVQGLMSKIDPVKTPALIKRIIQDSLPKYRDGGGPNAFDDWYEDRFSRGVHDQAMLLYAIFEWNYGDPIEWVKKTLANLPQKESASENGQGEVPKPS